MLGTALSIGGRLVAAVAALFVAADQTYDPTQVFAIGLAAIAIARLAPLRGSLGTWITGLAAGTLFFGAALLIAQVAGILMLLAAIASIAGIVIVSHRAGSDLGSPLGAFFFGLGATVAWWSLTFFIVEGGLPFEGALPF